MTLTINPDATALAMRREPKRDRCSHCLATFALKKDGTIRHHLGDYEYPGSRWRKLCPGTDKPPAVMQTPIPAAHRRIYHEALRAGLAEAERRDLELDALPFAAFHRALYRPMLDAHEAEVRAKVADETARAIEDDCRERHDRLDGEPCEDCERAAAIARQHAVRPDDPSHGQNAGVPGEQTPDGAGKAPERHQDATEPAGSSATSTGTN